MRRLLLLPVLLSFAMCASQKQLSLDEKIGQMFAIRANGVFMGESSASYQQMLHQVRDNHVGLANYGMSDFVYDVKAACARSGVVFDNDLFNAVVKTSG